MAVPLSATSSAPCAEWSVFGGVAAGPPRLAAPAAPHGPAHPSPGAEPADRPPCAPRARAARKRSDGPGRAAPGGRGHGPWPACACHRCRASGSVSPPARSRRSGCARRRPGSPGGCGSYLVFVIAVAVTDPSACWPWTVTVEPAGRAFRAPGVETVVLSLVFTITVWPSAVCTYTVVPSTSLTVPVTPPRLPVPPWAPPPGNWPPPLRPAKALAKAAGFAPPPVPDAAGA